MAINGHMERVDMVEQLIVENRFDDARKVLSGGDLVKPLNNRVSRNFINEARSTAKPDEDLCHIEEEEKVPDQGKSNNEAIAAMLDDFITRKHF